VIVNVRADDEEVPHHPQNRDAAESKLRRSGKRCPICLAPLPKNAPRTRLQRACGECQAHVSRGKHCRRCGKEALWENKDGAACQSCGLHGTKRDVISPPAAEAMS
jgi:hypothetical protein